MIVSQKEIIKALNNGEVVGIPTDTVYGFAALEQYQSNIYKLKNRDKNKKLIKFISSIKQMNNIIDFNGKELENITNEYWPGSNTLIFNTSDDMVSYRMPNEENVMNLLLELDDVLLTTSANISGEDPCLTSEDFIKRFPNIKLLREDVNTKKSNVPSSIFIIKEKEIKKIR